MHMVLASLNACELVNQVTRYSCEIFGFLIAVIYIDNAITEIIEWFYGPLSNLYLEAALLSLLICVGTFYLAITFHHARKWSILIKHLRGIVSDYGKSLNSITYSKWQYAFSTNLYSLITYHRGDILCSFVHSCSLNPSI
jgi:hypothetical protein